MSTAHGSNASTARSPIERLAAARALDSVSQVIVDMSSLAFMVGYSRSEFGALPFEQLCAFADQHQLPRLAALMAQVQLRGTKDPIDHQALIAVGALDSKGVD